MIEGFSINLLMVVGLPTGVHFNTCTTSESCAGHSRGNRRTWPTSHVLFNILSRSGDNFMTRCKRMSFILQVYLDDSLGERVWVDRADCKPFTDNIVTAFSTKLSPKNPTLLENLSYILPGTAAGRVARCLSPHIYHVPALIYTAVTYEIHRYLLSLVFNT